MRLEDCSRSRPCKEGTDVQVGQRVSIEDIGLQTANAVGQLEEALARQLHGLELLLRQAQGRRR